ncbi:hypothetical protein ACFZDG_13210 [Kitasatospora xanthocidica]|uniref:hypothetical protein n=1 Tax=Kitasatospora xanthocidica TaxID=83382 RepID=UPI0036E22406
MASATVNTLRELGGVLGIAVLGAVLLGRARPVARAGADGPRQPHPAEPVEAH